MSTYVQALQRHLGSYKSSRLGVDEPGEFFHRGERRLYTHILPAGLRWLNILEPYRAEIRRYVESRPNLKLHKFFHHLNSSQAFTLNLFFPYFELGDSALLLRALGLSGDCIDWGPEHVADAREGTNVDVSWSAANGARTYCEVKLSEQDFGKATDDERHQRKLTEIYAPMLRGKCAEHLLEPSTFFASYQVFRNVWLAARDPKASVLFLLPRANSVLWQRLEPILTDLSPTLRARVHATAIEDTLLALAQGHEASPRLAIYARALKEKYVISLT